MKKSKFRGALIKNKLNHIKSLATILKNLKYSKKSSRKQADIC
jgi:hypothetical protein